MDERPVDDGPVEDIDVHRLEVIESDSGERLYRAMREQSQRGHDFQRRFRWLWFRQDLALPSAHVAPTGGRPALGAKAAGHHLDKATDTSPAALATERVIDLRGAEATDVLRSTEEPPAPPREGSA